MTNKKRVLVGKYRPPEYRLRVRGRLVFNIHPEDAAWVALEKLEKPDPMLDAAVAKLARGE